MSDNNSPFGAEIKLTSSTGATNWADAFKELAAEDETAASTSTASTTPPAIDSSIPETPPPGSAPKQRPLSRYEEMIRAPSLTMNKEDINAITEFSEMIAKVNAAQRSLEKLRTAHPELFNERMYSGWTANLKETGMIMLKEFHALRNGRQQKKYDKRFVCSKCHSVFMVPLPPEGLCDECKGSKTPRLGGAY